MSPNNTLNGLTGSAVRALRRELDVRGYTRAQATKIIAATEDLGMMDNFLGHKNKHVRRYAFHKLGYTAIVRGYIGKLGEIFGLLATQAQIIPTVQEAPKEPGFLETLARQYGEEPSLVESLMAEKGGDLAAVKRSLISRKSARTRAAAKANAA